MHRTAIVNDMRDKLKLIVSIMILIELNYIGKQLNTYLKRCFKCLIYFHWTTIAKTGLTLYFR